MLFLSSYMQNLWLLEASHRHVSPHNRRFYLISRFIVLPTMTALMDGGAHEGL